MKKITGTLWISDLCNYLFKCISMKIFLETSRSSHESHHVGTTVVQLSRDIEGMWISLRETEYKLPFSRNMVYFQDFLSYKG